MTSTHHSDAAQASQLYPNERAVLRVFADAGDTLTLEAATRRLRSGARGKLALGVQDAIHNLDAFGYLDVVAWTANTPSAWTVTAAGRVASDFAS